MANSALLAASGLSGNSVRGMADTAPETPAETFADSTAQTVEDSIHKAADLVEQAIGMTGDALGEAVGAASDKAFESAASVGAAMPAQPDAIQAGFSWSGYLQAIGILCLLLAALWFAVWAIRRYGKFNFLPRPGALPKDALIMEAQMPIGPKKGLMVVRFLDKRLLLGVSDHQISLLTEAKIQNGAQDNDFQHYLDHNSDNSHPSA